MADSKQIPGFYVATCPWLESEFMCKVGHTGDLRARLHDSAYVTCFPPNHWRYEVTFETTTKEDAALIETAVLHCFRHRRLAPRELVRSPAHEIANIAASVANLLSKPVVQRILPEYPQKMRDTKEAPPAPEHVQQWAIQRQLVEHLTVGVSEAEMSSYIDELLSQQFDTALDLTVPTPPALPQVALPPVVAPQVARPPVVAPPVALPQHGTPHKNDDAIFDEVEDGEFVRAVDAVEEEIAGPFDITTAHPLVVRDYQRMAAERCEVELRNEGKAVLQMACRCGKTPVAYEIMQSMLADPDADERPVCGLYLVPGLPLLRQTAQKLASYGFTSPMLLVGSDPRPVALPGGRTLTMTTDPSVVRAFVAERGRRLVISTYQSSPQIPTDAFILTVFDEAHRVCGGSAPRPFNAFVAAPRAGARLFMTATPAYERADITMKDKTAFGGVAYRYHLRRGIAAGHVNDFKLEIVAAPSTAPNGAAITEDEAIPAQLMAAMSQVDKLLVFCRNISHATRLRAALEAAQRPPNVAPFECLEAHSRMKSESVAGALRRLAAPGTRAVLFNCRLFQEGVEIPALNGVFFASPRHSPRDIIQSVCRPLNSAPGKPTSVIFLPVLHDAGAPAEDPANLKRYASIVPFVDALLDEDPQLYEHLLDPEASPYPISVLGTHSLRLGTPASRAALLRAVRTTARRGANNSKVERLLRVDKIPWDIAFAELRRVVEVCGRYPKSNDLLVVGSASTSLHNFYEHCATQYANHARGAPHKLEPYQLAALAALPGWEPFGVEGPYPWKLCMEFLEQWLEEHDGVPPMITVTNSEYVGLDASAMERLSGCMRCINQQDGSRFTVSKEKQADLDRVCARFGLRWRRIRRADGKVDDTAPLNFIKDSDKRFKEYYRAHGREGEYIQRWFEGFPFKHKVMERLDVHKAGTAPPKKKKLPKKKTPADGAADGAAESPDRS